MKTNGSHNYHGITLRNDDCGWMIQLKMLGKYRQLRTHASTADVAARRHDVALARLDAFVEPTATPNFPADFENLDTSRGAFSEEDGGLAFFDEMTSLFSTLCKEADAVGLDPVDMSEHRKAVAKQKLEDLKSKRALARSKMSTGLLKYRSTLPSLGLSVDATKHLASLLEQTKTYLDSAS